MHVKKKVEMSRKTSPAEMLGVLVQSELSVCSEGRLEAPRPVVEVSTRQLLSRRYNWTIFHNVSNFLCRGASWEKSSVFLVGGSNTLPYIFLTFWILFRLVFFRMFASFEFLVDDL